MTRWTRVMALRSDDAEAAEVALSELCETYWMPVYSFYRRQGKAVDDAQDLTQGFFEQLISRNDFGRADEARGRLRNYLLTSAKHYLISAARKQSRQKRGGDAIIFSMDAEDAEGFHSREALEDLSPEKLYERQWAVVTLDKVKQMLAAEYEGRGRAEVFAVMGRFLGWNEDDQPYAEAAVEAGLSEQAFRAGVSRMRKRYRALLRESISDTLLEGEDVDEEIRHLVSALG